MSYRTINVDGTDYQYTVGRHYTKVKGVKLFSNHQIGRVIDDDTVAVQPVHVSNAIRLELSNQSK